MLTLTGAGGCGKTRLSQQAAIEALASYPDGIWLVELAALTDPERLPRALAGVLEVKEEPGHTTTESLLTYLKPRRLLLLLDNCEHLVEAVAILVDRLLAGCAQLTILATSREGLGVQGEQNYRVPPLSLPSPPFESVRVEDLAVLDSVRLLLDRIEMHRPEFVLTGANAPTVAQFCARLDGIPLAIELAAARTRSLGVEEINARLDDRFRLLTGGSRTALPRQQTLRALIDWSYDLLTQQEKDLLCRLSVFSGGWSLEAAESVCQSDQNEDWEILDHLTNLTDKSLVTVEPDEHQTRYRLLETVRQYAHEHLKETGESETVRERHRDYYCTWLAALDEEAPNHGNNGNLSKWQKQVTEYDNIWAAMEWKRDEQALDLAIHLRSHWILRGQLREGQAQLESLLVVGAEAFSVKLRARGLQTLGILQRFQGDYPAAHASLTEALALAEQLGELNLIAIVLSQLGVVYQYQGSFALAQECYEKVIALGDEVKDTATAYNSLGVLHSDRGELAAAQDCMERAIELYQKHTHEKHNVALVLGNLGVVHGRKGELDRAKTMFEESIAVHRELGDRQGVAATLDNLGYLALIQGDDRTAQVYTEEGLTLRREIGDLRGAAINLRALSDLMLRRGEIVQAKTYLLECFNAWRGSESLPGLASWLSAVVSVCAAQSDAQGVAVLMGATDALYQHIGLSRSPDMLEKRAKQISDAQAALDPETFEVAHESGKALSLEDAIALALTKL
ncbi:MAG: tetratricopeptide repeat protein [Armatimonas sp.]